MAHKVSINNNEIENTALTVPCYDRRTEVSREGTGSDDAGSDVKAMLYDNIQCDNNDTQCNIKNTNIKRNGQNITLLVRDRSSHTSCRRERFVKSAVVVNIAVITV